MNRHACEHEDLGEGWCGDATSVVEFLRPLRDQLDAPGVLEVCVNRPGELLVETVRGWQTVPAPEMTQERCLSLATAVATSVKAATGRWGWSAGASRTMRRVSGSGILSCRSSRLGFSCRMSPVMTVAPRPAAAS